MSRFPPSRNLPLAPDSNLFRRLARIDALASEIEYARFVADSSGEQWIEREFVFSAVRIERLVAPDEALIRAIEQASDSEAGDEVERHARALARAARMLIAAVQRWDPSPGTAIDSGMFARIYQAAAGEPAGQESSEAGDQTPEARLRMARIEMICDWAGAESFLELHAMEQAAIVLLRTLEIEPPGHRRYGPALAAASLVTARSSLPPVVIPAALVEAFEKAVRQGGVANTGPMVEVLAEAMISTLEKIMGSRG